VKVKIIFCIIILFKEINKEFECSNKKNKHYQKKIIVVSDKNNQQMEISFWRKFAEVDFEVMEFLLLENLVFKKNFHELATC